MQFNKVTTLPGSLEPDSFYFVENGTYAESYVTDDEGQARSIGNSTMINALISAALANWSGESSQVTIVPDITARDALIASAETNLMILVVDATGDSTVTAGSALYAYDLTVDEVYKIAEYESMDVIPTWESIQGGPTSTPAQIDSAVTQAHSHSNKAVLDLLSEGAGNQLQFRGVAITTDWSTNNW